MQIEIKDQCVGDHMTELMSAHPEMSHEQMVAIALKKCGQSKDLETAEKAASWSVGAARDLPISKRDTWDGPAAAERILNWAGFNGSKPDSAKARRGFLVFDSSAPDLKGSYKLPFADVSNGGLVAVDAGLRAAASRLPQSQIGDAENRARAVIDAYQKRMNAAEKKDMGMDMPMDAVDDDMDLSQDETNYVTVSPKTGESQCANCRWFQWRNFGDTTSDCKMVECYPLPILPTGYCDRWEAVPEAPAAEPSPIPVTIVGGTYGVDGEADTPMEMELTPLEPGTLERSSRRLLGKPLPGYTLTKDRDGRRLMVIFTSSGYKDREFEHVAQKALANYVESQWKRAAGGSLVWAGDNVHLLWHMKQLGPIGDIVWAGMIEGFLVEVAKERNHLIAKLAYDFIEAHPELDWGASQGFKVRKMQDDTYTDIYKFETSSLPRAFAAHPLTYSGVVKMVDKNQDPKAAILDAMFEIEDVAGILATGGPKALNQALAERGVSAKELSQAAPAAPEAAEKPDFAELMAKLITGQAEMMDRLNAIGQTQTDQGKALADEQKARADLVKTVQAQLAMAQSEVDKVKAQMSLAPRSVIRDADKLNPVSDAEAQKIKDQLPKQGSDFWFGAVPPERQA